MVDPDKKYVYEHFVLTKNIPLNSEHVTKWMTLQDHEINDFLINLKQKNENKEFNRFIGYIGEFEAAVFYLKKGFNISHKYPIDLIISKKGITCGIDVKITSQDKWFPKKYFKNKENQQRFFGYSIDEYLRLKILLNPYRLIFNDEDLDAIFTYFNGKKKMTILDYVK